MLKLQGRIETEWSRIESGMQSLKKNQSSIVLMICNKFIRSVYMSSFEFSDFACKSNTKNKTNWDKGSRTSTAAQWKIWPWMNLWQNMGHQEVLRDEGVTLPAHACKKVMTRKSKALQYFSCSDMNLHRERFHLLYHGTNTILFFNWKLLSHADLDDFGIFRNSISALPTESLAWRN